MVCRQYHLLFSKYGLKFAHVRRIAALATGVFLLFKTMRNVLLWGNAAAKRRQ
jgi:hypothetical protein